MIYATHADSLFILDGLHYTAYLIQDFSYYVALVALQNVLIISKSLAQKKIKQNKKMFNLLQDKKVYKIKIKLGGNKTRTPHCPLDEI